MTPFTLLLSLYAGVGVSILVIGYICKVARDRRALGAILAAEDPDAAKELVKQGAHLMGKLGGRPKKQAKP